MLTDHRHGVVPWLFIDDNGGEYQRPNSHYLYTLFFYFQFKISTNYYGDMMVIIKKYTKNSGTAFHNNLTVILSDDMISALVYILYIIKEVESEASKRKSS